MGKKAVSLHEKNTTHFCLNLQEHYMWFRIHVVAFFYHTSPGRTNHRVCFHTLQCPHNRNTAWKLSSSLIKEKINVNMSLFFTHTCGLVFGGSPSTTKLGI